MSPKVKVSITGLDKEITHKKYKVLKETLRLSDQSFSSANNSQYSLTCKLYVLTFSKFQMLKNFD